MTQLSRNMETDLLSRLSVPGSPVILRLCPPNAPEVFQKRLQMGRIYLRFAGKRGVTELGINVDQNATDTKHADFSTASGSVHLEGLLTLNGENVRCIADIDLKTLSGTGHLQRNQAEVQTDKSN